MEIKTIKVNEDTWKKLSKWKLDLNCKTLAEVVDRILSITPASEIKNKRSSVQGKTLPASYSK